MPGYGPTWWWRRTCPVATDLEVKDNQVVKVGDVLMRIDQNATRPTWSRPAPSPRPVTAQYLLRQNEAARRSRLGIGAISAEDKENAQINAAIARSEHAQEALAQVKIAELNLKRSELRAARNGQVTNLRLAQGNYATAGQAVMARSTSSPSMWSPTSRKPSCPASASACAPRSV